MNLAVHRPAADPAPRRCSGRSAMGRIPPGFTLIELLIASAILAVLGTAVAACLAGGLRVWDVAQDFNAAARETEIGLALLEKDVMNAFPLTHAGLKGDSSSLSFPALAYPGEGGGPRVLLVGYVFDESRRSLLRTKREYPEGEAAREQVVSHVEQVLFRYGRQAEGGESIEWRNSWDNATGLPSRVEIHLSVAHRRGPVSLVSSVIPAVRWMAP
jgi:prepilin-type N-terminal cleavage/methylation domain-containing protein